ncbi:ATP-binding protein [Dactylosporangium cerinum]
MRGSTGEHTVASPARVPGNLVAPLTSFVGRHTEIEAAAGLLERHRLVTLTGPGGAGKTRLAAQVAADRSDRYPDGVWWVDLATVSDGTAVAETVAEAVGAPIVGGRVHALRNHLAGWRSLLCLDNAEHLLDGVASTVEAVLHGCAQVSVLVTSREPLGVPGEAVLGVPPLSDDDALSLFVDRARLVQPSFALDESNTAAIRSIAAHLDGIPLALELAAAWLRTLTPGRWRRVWTTGSRCSSAVPVAHSGASAPSPDPSTGATRCWTRPTASCSAGSPCSPGRSVLPRRGRSAPGER